MIEHVSIPLDAHLGASTRKKRPQLEDPRQRHPPQNHPRPLTQFLYNILMPYEWDEEKRRSNLSRHRVDFQAIHRFEWNTATYEYDDRHHEPRIKATGFIGVVLYTVIYTERGDNTRIISLRKASREDIRKYAQA